MAGTVAEVTREGAARGGAETHVPSLAVLRREAAYTAGMTGLTEPFMIPYALALGATGFEAGLLSSARNLFLSLVQLKSADVVGWLGSRKRVVLWCVGVQAVLWLPLAAAAPLFGTWAVGGVILCYTLGSAGAALGTPAWGSLVAEWVPAADRGRVLGARARLVGLCTTLAGLVAGGLLQLTKGHPILGFGLLCAAAGLCRVLAWDAIRRAHEPPWQETPALRFTFWKFVRQVRRSNFARFSLCLGGLSFATHLAAPFFAVYLIRELQYGYLLYTTIVLAGSVGGSLASAWWGRVGDRVGNLAVLRWTFVGVAVVPALWPISSDPRWMTAVNVGGALLWSGLNLCAANFLYDAVSAPKRHTCLAYFNVIHGLGVSAGAFVGGWALDVLPAVGVNAFVALFYASALLRLAAALAFRRAVREVRHVGRLGFRDVVLDLVGQRLVQVLDAMTEERAPGGRRRRDGERR
jgi:MFS family permease